MTPTIANARQRRLWTKAVSRVDELRDKMLVLGMLNTNAAMAYEWGTQRGISVDSPAPLEQRYLDLDQRFSKLLQSVQRVENHTWGVQFRDGDIDIVDPQSEISGVLLVIAGVVVIAGLIATTYMLTTENDELAKDYRVLSAATDKKFCKQGSPKTCAEWKKFKRESGYDDRKSVIEKITDGIGEAATTGTKWGLGIAIPIALVAFLWSQKK
jgi:hypothetical protein